MLVLKRHSGESIMIGSDITVTVLGLHLGLQGDRVRIGITAPKGVEVYHNEMYEKIKLERLGQQ
jgi:carbon storage regulator